MTNNEWNREPPQYKYGDDPSKPPPQEGFVDWGSSDSFNDWGSKNLNEPADMLRNAMVRPRQGITPWGVIKWILVFGVALFLVLTIVAMVPGFITGMESSL